MDADEVKKKFGDMYHCNERTFMLGIDRRFSKHIAERFVGRNTLETCSGGGFTTISLAKASHTVVSIDIDEQHLEQARQNVQQAGCATNVAFVVGDALDEQVLSRLPRIDAAFLDPDWAVRDENHVYRFLQSNTLPPADRLFDRIYKVTPNVALVLPPYIPKTEFRKLPSHECEALFFNSEQALYCLYFGELKTRVGDTSFYIGLEP